MSWFCNFGGAPTSGSAKTQNHLFDIADNALTDQSGKSTKKGNNEKTGVTLVMVLSLGNSRKIDLDN